MLEELEKEKKEWLSLTSKNLTKADLKDYVKKYMPFLE